MTDVTAGAPSKPVATSLTIQGVTIAQIAGFAAILSALLPKHAGQITTATDFITANWGAIALIVPMVIGGIMSVVGRLRASQGLH